MSNTLARIVFFLTAVFFAVFFIWPVFETLGGAFTGPDGKRRYSRVGKATQP